MTKKTIRKDAIDRKEIELKHHKKFDTDKMGNNTGNVVFDASYRDPPKINKIHNRNINKIPVKSEKTQRVFRIKGSTPPKRIPLNCLLPSKQAEIRMNSNAFERETNAFYYQIETSKDRLIKTNIEKKSIGANLQKSLKAKHRGIIKQSSDSMDFASALKETRSENIDPIDGIVPPNKNRNQLKIEMEYPIDLEGVEISDNSTSKSFVDDERIDSFPKDTFNPNSAISQKRISLRKNQGDLKPNELFMNETFISQSIVCHKEDMDENSYHMKTDGLLSSNEYLEVNKFKRKNLLHSINKQEINEQKVKCDCNNVRLLSEDKECKSNKSEFLSYEQRRL
ncbi:DgyrCDS1511 [Dimorphilus gyrociliatus]|uniref:DgyrCDS1511 n=1 Tax=Dimorphilus gyrociliatus TaxID=2664684 RepID=A0A7I8VCM3_9ANNE|nr:DgyrCDS1511 [Dimorphilus gyrociliatus]